MAGMENGENEDQKKEEKRVVLNYFKSIFSIRGGDTDFKGTSDGIRRDIVFRGHSVWILICSIVIASIGLNTNSTAVIIGAMLISPLMGPILGVGFSVGTYDWQMLTRSLLNFAVMVVVSLVTSYLYFWISPINQETSELLGRTKPTFLDALIGIAGGVAGIVAGSRIEKNNVVPGVAIATALMPPLCTAGYGMAIGNWNYFFGAFYLFIINSIFIAASTIVVVRYLGFPRAQYLEAARKKRLNRNMTLFIIAAVIPSGVLFSDLIRESTFTTRAQKFVNSELEYTRSECIEERYLYNKDSSRIDLYFIGERLDSAQITSLNEKLVDYELRKTQLVIHQSNYKDTRKLLERIREDSESKTMYEELYKRNEANLAGRDSIMQILEQELTNYQTSWITIDGLEKEIAIQYPLLESFSISRNIVQKIGAKKDTFPIAYLNWKRNTSTRIKKAESEKLAKWLEVRLKLDTVSYFIR